MRVEQKEQVIQQIARAFEQARSDFAKLREAVSRMEALADAKVGAGAVAGEEDRALRALGEAVWQATQAKTLEVPKELRPKLASVTLAKERRAAIRSQIGDLLKEGEEVAKRLGEKKLPRHSPLESRSKKR